MNGKNIGVVYHGSSIDIEQFDADKVSGGFHFGTYNQAISKGSKIIPVRLKVKNFLRSIDRDSASSWRKEIEWAKSMACDGIVYLNRFEGLPLLSWWDHAQEKLMKLSDAEFKRLMPLAEDSYIVFSASQIIIEPHDKFAVHKYTLDDIEMKV